MSSGSLRGAIDKISRKLAFQDRSAGSDAAAEPIKKNMPLVPSDSIAGRALVTVIAIMTFLAAFVVGLGVLFHNASSEWTDSISHEMTIQVRPAPNVDLDDASQKAASIARTAKGVASVRPFDKTESRQLLEPWLGSGLDLEDLPIPRLIVIELSHDVPLDARALEDALRKNTPTASLDDHRLWIERLALMVRTLAIVIAVFVTLVLVALGLAIAFATRGAMAGNKGIIEVLHFVGATDSYIAKEFQRHFLKLGFRGGAIGVITAVGVFTGFGLLASTRTQSAGFNEISAFFGTFTLGPLGLFVIVAIGAAVAILTGAVSRIIVFRHLRRMV